MTSILKGKTTKDDTEVAIFTLRAISTDPPPPFMHVTVTFYFYSHLTSQLHGASLLYVDFILLVTWERRTRHWGDFLHGIMFVLLIYFE